MKVESSRADLGKVFIDLLLKCHRAERHIASSARMTVDEFHALILLYTHKPQRVGQLSALLGVRDTRMSKILNALEEKGYLVRRLSTVDRRVEDVSLTPRGTHTVEDVLAKSNAISHRLFASHTSESKQVLGQLIEELAVHDWSATVEQN